MRAAVALMFVMGLIVLMPTAAAHFPPAPELVDPLWYCEYMVQPLQKVDCILLVWTLGPVWDFTFAIAFWSAEMAVHCAVEHGVVDREPENCPNDIVGG